MQSHRDGTAGVVPGLETASQAAAKLALSVDEDTNAPLQQSRFIIHPDSLVRESFESVLKLMTVAGTFVLPLPVAFPTISYSDVLQFDILLYILYTVDLLMYVSHARCTGSAVLALYSNFWRARRFLLAYFDEGIQLVSDRSKIMRKYLRTRFVSLSPSALVAPPSPLFPLPFLLRAPVVSLQTAVA
jgi:hypothetical protein